MPHEVPDCAAALIALLHAMCSFCVLRALRTLSPQAELGEQEEEEALRLCPLLRVHGGTRARSIDSDSEGPLPLLIRCGTDPTPASGR